jgi:putative PIN family toxin of toxin-antitoxin system
MRIVADTNTVLSGLLWAGPPRRLLDRARERTLTLCTSATLLAELAEVIVREKFVQRVQAAGLSAAELVQDYERPGRDRGAPATTGAGLPRSGR